MTNQRYFKPSKFLTFATVTEQSEQFMELLEMTPIASIHCDLGGVQICDSAGLAFLIGAKRLCRKQNSQFHIENASIDILALAKLYGVEKFLDNEEEP